MVEFRADRKSGVIAFTIKRSVTSDTHGKPRPKRVTESAARTDLEKHGPVPCTSLVSVAAWFLIDSAENQKVSEWISNMRYTLDRLILPFFGEHKNVGEYHAPERRGVC